MPWLLLILFGMCTGVLCHKYIRLNYFLVSIIGAILASLFNATIINLFDDYHAFLSLADYLFYFVLHIPITATAGIPFYVSRSPRHASAGMCQACGYNLTGLTENRCPECGTPFIQDSKVLEITSELKFFSSLAQVLVGLTIFVALLLLWASYVFAGKEKIYDMGGIWLWIEVAAGSATIILLNVKQSTRLNWAVLGLIFPLIAASLLVWWQIFP